MSIAYTGISGKAQTTSAASLAVTLNPFPSAVGDYVSLAIFVQNSTGTLPVVSSITDNALVPNTYLKMSGFEEISSSGSNYFLGVWYAQLNSIEALLTGLQITVNFSATEDNIALMAAEFSGIGGIDAGCNVSNHGVSNNSSANLNVARQNELIVSGAFAISASAFGADPNPGLNWDIADQFTAGFWDGSFLLYQLLGNTYGSQTAVPIKNTISPNPLDPGGWVISLGGFIPSTGPVPPAPPSTITLAILELNGGGNPITLDTTSTGAATFTGGSDTRRPSLSAVLSSELEAVISAIAANGASVTMVARPGYQPLLVPTPSTGLFLLYPGSETGSINIQPAALSSSVDSALCVLTLAANQVLENGYTATPSFPDIFSPRSTDYLYDSLQGDSTFVANEFGPQPYLDE